MGAVYVLDKHNNYFESLTKEEIIALIETAAAGGDFKGFSNTAFVSKIRELNKGADFGVWVGTQAEYNAIPEYARQKNVLYLISDDPLCRDLPNKVAELVQAQRNNDEKFAGYDETENLLKAGFAEITEGFEEIQQKHDEVLDIFDEIKGTYGAAMEVIFESAEGERLIPLGEAGHNAVETTRAIEEFKEICIVYEVDTNANMQSPYKQQKRLITADVGEFINISESLIGEFKSATSTHDINTVNIFVKVSRIDYYTRQATSFSMLRGATNSAENPSFKIYKIYGIGEVK